MNKIVKCAACGESYNLDLDKYGGKKIKCKKCQEIITVPAAAPDDFEVVEENVAPAPAAAPPPVAPTPAAAAGAPPAILQRHRMASQRGAVNIALLQRSEPDRQTIRNNFLAVHGDEGSRLAKITALDQRWDGAYEGMTNVMDNKKSLEDALKKDDDASLDKACKLAEQIAGPLQAQKGPSFFKSIAASIAEQQKPADKPALIEPQNPVAELAEWHYIAGGQQAGPVSWTQLQGFAASGKLRGTDPVWKAGMEKWVPGGSLPDLFPSAKPAAAKAVGFFKGAAMGVVGFVQQKKEVTHKERQAKVDLIKNAIETLAQMEDRLSGEVAELTNAQEQAKAELHKGSKKSLQSAEAMTSGGQLEEASAVFQDLVKRAPVELLGQVLVGLSKCAFLSGNASDAARQVQDAICFGASTPVGMGPDYNDLWAKAAAGLPKA